MNHKLGGVHVKVTPLLGGREEGAVCTLLEIGNSRLLLDCGCLTGTPASSLQHMRDKLEEIGPIDAILLSHADMAHVGGLPFFFGEFGKHGFSPHTKIQFIMYIHELFIYT